MWYCNNCKEEFTTPEKEQKCFEKHFEVSNLFDTIHYFDLLKCPNCKSDDIEEMKECDYCGEYNKEDDLQDTEGAVNGNVGYLCPQCIEDCSIKFI